MMKKNLSKKKRQKFKLNFLSIFLIYIFIIFLISTITVIYSREQAKHLIEDSKETEIVKPTTEEPKVIPEKYQLQIPYTVQAPLVNWDVHEESCEEAALLMVHYYLQNKIFPNLLIPKDVANQELIKMVEWQKKNYGKEYDLDMRALGRFANQYYGYKYEVKENVNRDDIKEAIYSGFPVIVPVMTKSLENPHYNINSVYHVVLVTGYDVSGVITNDAGVKEGQNWHYSWEVLWKAIDAQTSKMQQGRDILILKK